MASAGRQKPSGTLASAAESNAVIEPALDVAVVSARTRAARGISPILVVVLVLFSLVVGFLLGWAAHS